MCTVRRDGGFDVEDNDEEASQEDLDELLRLQVQLLFQRLNSGSLMLSDHLTETSEALKAVKFDKRGLPLLHTVPERVRSFARTYAMTEGARMHELFEKVASESPIHNLLPESTEVNEAILAQCVEKRQFMPVAYPLYTETIAMLYICCSVYPVRGEGPKTFPRNQAICVGSLVRIAKLMRATAELASQGSYREIIHGLSRSIADSVVTIRFLILKDQPALFDQFVESSLGPEKEQYTYIHKKIAEHGGVIQPIEARMLDSIENVCFESGVNIEDVDPRHKEWGGNFPQRLEALGDREAYAGIFRMPSHAIHGSWVDLLMNHLNYEGGEFSLEMETGQVDQRLLLPIALFVLEAVQTYLAKFFPIAPELSPLYKRIADLTRRIQLVEDAHDQWRDEALKRRQNATTGHSEKDG